VVVLEAVVVEAVIQVHQSMLPLVVLEQEGGALQVPVPLVVLVVLEPEVGALPVLPALAVLERQQQQPIMEEMGLLLGVLFLLIPEPLLSQGIVRLVIIRFLTASEEGL
jgi:hypothetical protein